MKLASTNDSGARTSPKGKRYERGSSGLLSRRAPRARGAPAYISTDALVTTLTSDAQLGNGRRNKSPTTVVTRTLNTGIFRAFVFSKTSGMYPFLLSPKLIRDADVR